MSERNVDLTRRFLETYNARNIDAMAAYFDPSIEFHAAFAAVAPTVYHGHDGMRKWHRELEEAWQDGIVRLEPEAYFDLGELTLVFWVLHARGRHSGADVAMPGASVLRWRDGLMIYAKTDLHRQGAVSDLGVSEDELKPIDP
jgi:ketosteroid isomerase-like protein